MRVLNRDRVIEIFRDNILDALDEAASQAFGTLDERSKLGAMDSDLPRIFRAIDQQVETLASRFDVALVEYDPAALAKDPHFNPFAPGGIFGIDQGVA